MDQSQDERIRERAKTLWEKADSSGRVEDHLHRAERDEKAEQLAALKRNVKNDVPGKEQVAGQTDTPVGAHIESIARSGTRRPPD